MRKMLTDFLNQSAAGRVLLTASEAGEVGTLAHGSHTFQTDPFYLSCLFPLTVAPVEQSCFLFSEDGVHLLYCNTVAINSPSLVC